MRRLVDAVRVLATPRVRRALALAYLLGLILAIVAAWGIAAFVRMTPQTTSTSAIEEDESRTVSLERTPVSLHATITRVVGLSWSPGQATGSPNTWRMGDIASAWASLSEDGQDEWLELEYSPVVAARSILVYESFNPGALSRITSVDVSGKEDLLWAGADPAQPSPSGVWIAKLPIQAPGPIRRIRLYLDSRRVRGWNEIDAVGLVDADGAAYWAAKARASSTYASPSQGTGSSTTSFGELAQGRPRWMELDPARLGFDAIEYQAYGWPFLAMHDWDIFSPADIRTIHPWRPLWGGLLANGAVYGAILLLLYALTFGLRRFLRQSLWLRRGCCMQCGYDLRFDLARGCPECGWRRDIQPNS